MSQRRILLFEDEPNTRFPSSTILERASYGVDVAEDGSAALPRIQRHIPDPVIAYLRTPNMNALELRPVIRTNFPELPTLAISGESSDQIVLHDFQAGHPSPHADVACCSVER